jgi:hypothetical protein
MQTLTFGIVGSTKNFLHLHVIKIKTSCHKKQIKGLRKLTTSRS